MLIRTVEQFQTRGRPVSDNLLLLEEIRKDFNSMTRKIFAEKLDAIMRRNAGYKSLQKISQILNGDEIEQDELLIYLPQR